MIGNKLLGTTRGQHGLYHVLEFRGAMRKKYQKSGKKVKSFPITNRKLTSLASQLLSQNL